MPAQTHSDAERELVETARRVLPGGSFGNVPDEVIIAEGRGGRVWDVSGNEYVDFLLGSGPMFVGHAHPEVTAAVQAQIATGHDVLRQQPARHPARRRDRRRRAVRRAGALRQLAAPRPTLYAMRARPRLPQARQDPQVRGRLSRHERLRR